MKCKYLFNKYRQKTIVLDMNSKGKQKSRIINSQTSNEFSENESEYSNEEEFNYLNELSESSDETESTDWDKIKIIPKKTSKLLGYHLMPTCARDPELQMIKRQKLSYEKNVELNNVNFINNLTEYWNKNVPLLHKNVEILVDPFKLCVIKDFLHSEELVKDIRQEFYELNFNQRNMDLYEFFQSKDLQYLNSPHLKNFYEFLKNDVMNWVANITNLNLTHVSATCSVYTNTDYLLVHDDQREDRLVAFIFYLTNSGPWTEDKGGALQLFNKDHNLHPHGVVKNIFPLNNQFIFFPVTNDSYHQVGEVTCLSDCRMSINGWFHTKTPPIFETPLFNPSGGLFGNIVLKSKDVDIDLELWINENYLEVAAINLIQKQIEENSEISLKNFFKEESFGEILQTLQSKDIEWRRVGPPNRYSYEVLNCETLPHSLERFLDLFQSKAMFHLLQKYTDLELTTVGASMKFELQKWTPGSYSLLTDHDWQLKNELDLIMYFGCQSSSDVIGAQTQYVTIEDEIQNALITLDPEDNNLNIVFRDSARFTKYFSKQSKCKKFFTLICSYSE